MKKITFRYDRSLTIRQNDQAIKGLLWDVLQSMHRGDDQPLSLKIEVKKDATITKV